MFISSWNQFVVVGSRRCAVCFSNICRVAKTERRVAENVHHRYDDTNGEFLETTICSLSVAREVRRQNEVEIRRSRHIRPSCPPPPTAASVRMKTLLRVWR